MAKHVSERRTEDIVLDLLYIQGWNTAKPPRGYLVRQNEYKAIPELEGIFQEKVKKGKGMVIPIFC